MSSENSDSSSDEDYVPDTKSQEVLSEVDSDGDLEDDLIEETSNRSKKRTKNSGNSRKKQKATKIEDESISQESPKKVTEEEKKKIEEDVWADFMRDTGFQSKGNAYKAVACDRTKSEAAVSNSSTKLKSSDNTPKKVTVTEVFEFAGEKVTVQKQITENPSNTKTKDFPPSQSTKGIGGILNQLTKKSKITTLEKSKLDWDQFKREENIEEELQTHNKGRDGYLEKQDFLNRADLRRFEIEKKIRTIERSKRVNNA